MLVSADGPGIHPARRILNVTKPELGTKQRCNSCEAKFFDLNKSPIVCPMCEALFIPPPPEPVRSRRSPDRQPWHAPKETVPKVPNDLESPEETEVEAEAGSSPAVEGEGVLLLEDDQDGKLDASEIAGADIVKDDSH